MQILIISFNDLILLDSFLLLEKTDSSRIIAEVIDLSHMEIEPQMKTLKEV